MRRCITPRLLSRLGTALCIVAVIAGCSAKRVFMTDLPSFETSYVDDFAAPGGYLPQEAQAFIEFCVDLDNQDDRNKQASPGPAAQVYGARIDPELWSIAYDSRDAVAKDYIEYRNRGAQGGQPASDDDLAYWKKLYEKIKDTAADDRIPINTADDIRRNPDLNGFGPWQNAWTLYRGVGPNAGRYAIAIRGTVFSNAPSAIEDAIFQPLSGREFLSHAVSFSQTRDASLHGGFAHASFTLLLDRRYGILQTLSDQHVPAGSVLYIVGHSQGAAMATLVHAFLFNALYQAETGPGDPLGLRGARYRLKSYAFAQPKPGNYPFAAEFSRYTQRPDNALVINNHIDPVPQVPLTLQSTGDLESDFVGHTFTARLLRFVSGAGKGLRSSLAWVFDYFTRESAEKYGNFYHGRSLQPLGKDQRGSSWNFVPAGRVILVYGTRGPPNDLFYQHHATTYRELIAAQLATAR